MEPEEYSNFKFDNSTSDEINKLIELAEAEYNKIQDEEENDLNKSSDSSTEDALKEKEENCSKIVDEMNKLRDNILKTKVDFSPVEDQTLSEILDIELKDYGLLKRD